jgi:hypothetical protein
MKRHQVPSIRKPEKLTTTRARMLNPVVVTNYLNDLDALLDKLAIFTGSAGFRPGIPAS